MKDSGRAIADYTEATRLDPDFAEAYYNRGLAHGENGENDRAEEDLAQATELGCEP